MGPLYFISALVAYTSISCVRCQSECTLPNGGRGLCISINDCDHLKTLRNKQARYKTIRNSNCGSIDAPKVCCPNECYTVEGQLGSCIQVQSCPHVAALISNIMSEETTSYIQSSSCEGVHQYSVCCGQSVNLQVRPIRQTNCNVSAAPPDPRTECCGVDSSAEIRIYGGNATKIDQYPWLAIIEYKNNINEIELRCGGALISGKYVLTAGHCIVGPIRRYGTPTYVRLGEYDTAIPGPDCVKENGGGFDCTEGTVVILIERSIVHPEYDPNNPLKQNDIALLRLKRLVKFTDFIRPICLPTSDLTLNPPSNLKLFAAGWGANDTTPRSNIKLYVDLPYHSLESCQLAYPEVNLWEGQLCAGGEHGKDACKGDSGGPLMYYKNNRTWEVTGIVSFGKSQCGIQDVPGVYTYVFPYIRWMRSQIRP